MAIVSEGIPEFLERSCLEHVMKHAIRGDPKSVIAEIDKFAYDGNWMMNLGDKKGDMLDMVLDKVVREKGGEPLYCVEFGTYVGYSSVRFGERLPQGSRYLTFEVRPVVAGIASAMISFAELDDKVKVVCGSASIELLRRYFPKDTKLDFVFIDHWKDAYLKDLHMLERSGFLHKGTNILADNLGFPGSPAYKSYVEQNTTDYETKWIKSTVEYTDHEDVVGHSIVRSSAKFLPTSENKL